MTPRLHEISSVRQVWSEPYEITVESTLRLHAEIAKRVAEALRINLLEPKGTLYGEYGGTDNLVAFSYYTQANDYQSRSYEEAEERQENGPQLSSLQPHGLHHR